MAIFTPGPLVTSISGNVGGVNFAAGPRANYCRTAPLVPNSRTVYQLRSREAHVRHQLLWIAMTENIREYWRNGARQLAFPDRLGRLRHLSGYGLWMRYANFIDTRPPWAFHTYPQLVATTPPHVMSVFFTDAPHYLVNVPHVDLPASHYLSFHFARSHRRIPPKHFRNMKLVRTLTRTTPGTMLTDQIIERFGVLKVGEYFKLTVRVAKNSLPYALQSAPLSIVGAVAANPGNGGDGGGEDDQGDEDEDEE